MVNPYKERCLEYNHGKRDNNNFQIRKYTLCARGVISYAESDQ